MFMWPLFMVPLMIVAGIAIFFVISALFQWLWNITIPQVFGLKVITYWQAFRLLVISALLFGGAGIGTTFRYHWDHDTDKVQSSRSAPQSSGGAAFETGIQDSVVQHQ